MKKIKIVFNVCSFHQIKEAIKLVKELKKENPHTKFCIEISFNG